MRLDHDLVSSVLKTDGFLRSFTLLSSTIKPESVHIVVELTDNLLRIGGIMNGGSVGTLLEEKEGGVMIRKIRASGSILSYTLDMEKTIPMIEKRMNEDPGIYSVGNK